jgi:natural product biosynthesis luciferase-like monooxygenase protein
MQIDTRLNQDRPLAFGLYYFGSDEGGPQATAQRRLLLESARFADAHGFSALWAPERHFHAFGGLSPNPSVMGAALAAVTQRIRIRAGSVVVPLHHPARVVEEWSLVDVLSNGRVDLALASGWFPDDFVLAAPGDYERRHELVFERARGLRSLWAGEPFEAVNALGEAVKLRTMPRPMQPRLPLWITAAGNPQTFAQAGTMGLNLLTHLLGQSLESLGDKIAAYRAAWRAAGHPGQGTVSLMLHTFIGENDAEVRRTVKPAMLRYLASSANLVGKHTAAVPFFKTTCDAAPASEADMREALEFSFERYYVASSLLGTLDDALATTDKLKAIEVDEVACLIDFGVAPDQVLAALPWLDELRQLAQVSSMDAKALA